MLGGIATVSVTGDFEHQFFIASLKLSLRHDIEESVHGGFAARVEGWKESTKHKMISTELKLRTGTWAVCALWVIKADFGQ